MTTARKVPIPFEVFAGFKRIETGTPIISLPPPLWAAATHAIIAPFVEARSPRPYTGGDPDETLHYIWCKRDRPFVEARSPRPYTGGDRPFPVTGGDRPFPVTGGDRPFPVTGGDPGVRWLIMHATAPISDPTDITQDARNPILEPSAEGFDDAAVEYPFPFLNPADGKFYMYYRGKGKTTPEQTGLLVSDGDLGEWRRVQHTPVISADTEHERHGASHPSVAIEDDTIHIVYTGKATRSFGEGLTMCHATAPTSDPATVIKNPDNPVFTGSGETWDSRAVRETEVFKGPEYFHILYGGYDGDVWRIGHVRTRDFRTFEPNPYNPVFTPSDDPNAFDCDGVLTGQILEIENTYVMLYAGKKGEEWQTGLATLREN